MAYQQAAVAGWGPQDWISRFPGARGKIESLFDWSNQAWGAGWRPDPSVGSRYGPTAQMAQYRVGPQRQRQEISPYSVKPIGEASDLANFYLEQMGLRGGLDTGDMVDPYSGKDLTPENFVNQLSGVESQESRNAANTGVSWYKKKVAPIAGPALALASLLGGNPLGFIGKGLGGGLLGAAGTAAAGAGLSGGTGKDILTAMAMPYVGKGVGGLTKGFGQTAQNMAIGGAQTAIGGGNKRDILTSMAIPGVAGALGGGKMAMNLSNLLPFMLAGKPGGMDFGGMFGGDQSNLGNFPAGGGGGQGGQRGGNIIQQILGGLTGGGAGGGGANLANILPLLALGGLFKDKGQDFPTAPMDWGAGEAAASAQNQPLPGGITTTQPDIETLNKALAAQQYFARQAGAEAETGWRKNWGRRGLLESGLASADFMTMQQQRAAAEEASRNAAAMDWANMAQAQNRFNAGQISDWRRQGQQGGQFSAEMAFREQQRRDALSMANQEARGDLIGAALMAMTGGDTTNINMPGQPGQPGGPNAFPQGNEAYPGMGGMLPPDVREGYGAQIGDFLGGVLNPQTAADFIKGAFGGGTPMGKYGYTSPATSQKRDWTRLNVPALNTSWTRKPTFMPTAKTSFMPQSTKYGKGMKFGTSLFR